MKQRCITLAVVSLAMAGCIETAPTETALLEEAHAEVAKLMKDPASVQFDDTNTELHPNAGLVCQGKVNAKNSYGGYVGFENYAYSRTKGAAVANENRELWFAIMQDCSNSSLTEAEAINAKLKERGSQH